MIDFVVSSLMMNQLNVSKLVSYSAASAENVYIFQFIILTEIASTEICVSNIAACERK